MAMEFGSFSAAINALQSADLINIQGKPTSETVVLTATGRIVARSILSLTDSQAASADETSHRAETSSPTDETGPIGPAIIT
jgi:hypothetical protein